MSIDLPLGGSRPFPKEWPLFQIDDIKSPEPYSCVAGPFGSNISSKFFVDFGVPVIRGSNLTDDLTRFISKDFIFVSEERAANNYKAQQVKVNDLIFTCWGTIGQVGIIPENGPYPTYVISNKQLKLRVNPDLTNPLFVYYYFASPSGVRYLKSRASSSAVPGINLGILKSLTIALPPLSTQEKIVEILGAYDDLIANNNRRIELLEEAMRLLYREWFVHLRFPGWEKTEIVDGVPEGWEKLDIARACTSVEDGDWIETKDQGGSDYRLVQVSNIGIGQFIETGKYRYITEETFARLKCQEIEMGDILVSRMPKPIGRAWLVNDVGFKMITAVDVAILKANMQVIHPLLLTKQINSPYFLALAESQASGTTRPRITRKNLSKLPVIVPTRDVQRQFIRHAEPVYHLQNTLRQQNYSLRAARDALLPRLMSGRIEV